MFLYPFRSIAGGPMFQYCDGVTCSYSWMHFGMGHTLPSLNELIWDMLLAVPNEKLQPRKSIFNNGKIGWLGSFNGEDIYDIFLFTNVTAYINSLDPKKKQFRSPKCHAVQFIGLSKWYNQTLYVTLVILLAHLLEYWMYAEESHHLG